MNSIPETLNKKNVENRFKTILILGILTAYVPFSIDSYLPAVPNIAAYFGTSSARMTYSLSTFFIGFACGQILYGPLLDRFGRKTPIYFGILISILASVACILAWNATSFVIFRFIQALGASVASVSALAMVRDFFPPEESSKIFSLLVLVIGASPLLAPYLGSHILQFLNWHWIFVFLILMATVLLVLVRFALPTGYIPDANASLKIKVIARNYRNIISTPQFIIYALGGAFSFSSLFIYVAGSPIIFMGNYHITPKVFGYLFAGLSVGFIGGSQLNIVALKYFSSQKIFRFALISQFIIGLIYFTGVANQWFGLNMNVAFLFLVLLCIGFSSPNGIALALAPIRNNMGSASAMVGMIRIGVAGLTSTSIGLLNTSNSKPVAGMIFITAFISLIIMTLGLRRMKTKRIDVVLK